MGPLGAAVVAAERGADPPRASVLRDRVVALAAGQRTAHTLGVNGLFCALHAAARSRPDAVVGAWWAERRCAAEWGDFVRPDAYGVWEEAGHRVEFFVEHDTGTETLARVAAKLEGYRDLAEAEGPPRHALGQEAHRGTKGGPPNLSIDTVSHARRLQGQSPSASLAAASTLSRCVDSFASWAGRPAGHWRRCREMHLPPCSLRSATWR